MQNVTTNPAPAGGANASNQSVPGVAPASTANAAPAAPQQKVARQRKGVPTQEELDRIFREKGVTEDEATAMSTKEFRDYCRLFNFRGRNRQDLHNRMKSAGNFKA